MRINVPFNLIWKELYDLLNRPLFVLGIVLTSIAVVWIAGHLSVERKIIRVFVYKGDASEETIEKAQNILTQFAQTHVFLMDGNIVDSEAMHLAETHFAAIHRNGQWFVLYDVPSLDQEEEASRVSVVLADSLENNQSAMAGQVEFTKSDFSSRLSALPGEPHMLFVPRTIALIVVFLPFILAARSQFRESVFGTLPLLLVAPKGGWLAMVIAKTVSAGWAGLIVLLVLLLIVRPIFGFVPKPGLFSMLGVEIIAIVSFCCLGITVSIVSRNHAHVFFFMSAYFLILMLLSGFFSSRNGVPVDSGGFARKSTHIFS
jgi:ABC-2 type transporter